MAFLNDNKKNWSSRGIYDLRELDFSNIKDNALFIVMKDGKEIAKHQYIPVHKETIKYNNAEGKSSSLKITLVT